MGKYKINYTFNEEDINDVFFKVLNKELKKYIHMICKNKKIEVPSSCTRFSLEGGKIC